MHSRRNFLAAGAAACGGAVLGPEGATPRAQADAPRQERPRIVTIGLVQLRCEPSTERNLDRAIELIGKAAKAGAQLVVLPELFRTPYFCRAGCPLDQPPADDLLKAIADAKRDYAISMDGPVTERLSKAAAENEVVLVGGSSFEIEKTPAGEHYFNTSPVFDADGKLLGTYRKTHIPHDEGFWEQHYFEPGDRGFPVFDTAVGIVAVQICYDQWFPEGARLAALAGAEFLVYPTAIGDVDEIKSPGEGNWREMWTTAQAGHAVCNHLFVAAANRVGREGRTAFWGGSFVADPCGRVISRGGAAEEVLLASCDLSLIETMREWRFLEERRPERYSRLDQPAARVPDRSRELL
ncbi:MAG: nitrilase-related carbon-nitrogen hydrolase [Isosphaeraceae bacterium]|nr:nitrilase-related carbon-nitrogen hydrolase [Isosphaeraceae bacterium]